MLESLVAWVLNTYLGKYVENLNTHQLSIALLQGEVELENLPLRKDALKNLGIPIQVKAGFIGKVKLQIPVRAIRSAPWVILIEQLYLVATPVRLSEWDDEADEQANQDYKQNILDAMEAQWRAEVDAHQETSYYASSYSSWLSYGTSIVTNVIENLQLKIKDVHIRYEDDITIPGQMFACGIIMEGLSAQSCDDAWLPRYLTSDSGPNSFKLVELTALGIYWDKLEPEELFGDLSLGKLAVAMAQAGVQQKSHNFILSPVSAQAQLKRNRSEQPLRSRTQPRIVCDLNLEEVPLSLIDWQYGQMVGCLKGLQNIERSRRYRRYRPDCAVCENPRAWWIYIARCYRRPLNRASSTRTWEGVLKLARENVAYVTMYQRLLANPTATLQPESKEFKEAMEHTRSLEQLCSLREIAMRKIHPGEDKVPETASQPANVGKGLLYQWFPAWHYWYSNESATDSGEKEKINGNPEVPNMEQELEGQLLDALADSVENNTLLRRDAVFGQFNFTLKQGAFHLCSTNAETSSSDSDSNRHSLLELQFENVRVNLESRPRSSSQRLNISLGAVYVWDRLTKDTVFPVLVAPQGHDCAPSSVGNKAPRNFPPGLQRLRSQGAPISAGITSPSRVGQNEEPLFELMYEHKPFNSAVDYRLHIRSQSLDVVYNAAAVEWLTHFFTYPYQQLDWTLRRAARHGYQAMKQRTRQELMRNWERILEGHLSHRKTWELELDISAPQIILVEHFCDKNAVIAVVDFGRFHLSTGQKQSHTLENHPSFSQDAPPPLITSSTIDSEDEDAFQTPCSTPPGSAATGSESDEDTKADDSVLSQHDRSIPSQSCDLPRESLSESSLHHKLYDRYTIELNDMQILVGKVKDNWKYAHLKGTSTLHVLDRFNISLQIERRILFTRDPQYPSLTVSGNLPKLVVHVNEQKIKALQTMCNILSGRGLPSPFRSQDPPQKEPCEEDVGATADTLPADEDDDTDRILTRLVMLQFSIDQMSLEVQSRGRSVAELQVSGVKAGYTKRPYDTSMSLSVHSLLLVDALQTFGPDFELLVASHKHVGMDSVSGSLRDSEPTSPTSPGSPDVQSPRTAKLTSPAALSQALSNIQHESGCPITVRAVSPVWTAPSPPAMVVSPHPIGAFSANASCSCLMLPDALDHEALISIEIVFVSPDCPTANDLNQPGSKEALQIATIQFNNLDIIANQETIVELIGFTHRVFPRTKQSKRPPPPTPSEIDASQSCEHPSSTSTRQEDLAQSAANLQQSTQPATTGRTELSFDFHRLNVLLLRAVVKDNVHVGRKIATATMSEAKIQATIGQELIVRGSLGGLQVLDLTPEGQKHQRILSLGKDPLAIDRSSDLLSCLSADLYSMGQHTSAGQSSSMSFRASLPEAFSFSICRSLVTTRSKSPEHSINPTSEDQESEKDVVDIKLRMASVLYTHSPCLVAELSSCATEFKQYLSNLAQSIKSAATEAIGLVQARAEALAQSLYMTSRLSSSFHGGSYSELSSPKRRRRSVSRSYDGLDSGGFVTGSSTKGNVSPISPADDDKFSSYTEIRMDVVLDTPVVVMPRSATSSQVLVAHLGKITVSNSPAVTSSASQVDSEVLWNLSRKEQYLIVIRDMNLYSLDTSITKDNARSSSGFTIHGTNDCLPRAEQLYSCSDYGVPILHDTVIKLTVQRLIGMMRHADSLSSLLLGDDSTADFEENQPQDCLQISGSVVTPLKVSLSRQQYEQVIETVNSLIVVSQSAEGENVSASATGVGVGLGSDVLFGTASSLGDIAEEESELHTGVSTLSLDSTLRARMLQGPREGVHAKTEPSHFLTYKVTFELPIFVVELRGDMGDGEQSFVDLSFSEFKLQFDRQQRHETIIKMSLRSVMMEDLLQPPDSKHRFLMVSSCVNSDDSDYHSQLPAFVSKSCPNLSSSAGTSMKLHSYLSHHLHHHGSLPDHLENESAFSVFKSSIHDLKIRRLGRKPPQQIIPGEYPTTPPPSPQRCATSQSHALRDDTLVRIKVVLIDRNAPKLNTLFNNVHRHVKVDFNTLDVVVNVESWVVILDFFGFGTSTPTTESKVDQTEHVAKSATLPKDSSSTQIAPLNTKFDLEVWSLTLVLNRPQYEVARANVSQLSANIINRLGNLTLNGRLGRMSLMDATPHSSLYRERFVSSGSEALNLHYFRYGSSDTLMKREYDSQLRLEMSSVLYVHTQRFVAEISAFFHHFSQLQNVLSNIRASTEVPQELGRKSRRLLVVTAGSPVILLPLSSRSSEILVADLGKLTISNQFLKAGSESTISKLCSEPEIPNDFPLLDVMHIDLLSMDLYAGLRKAAVLEEDSHSQKHKQTKSSLLCLGSFCVEKRGPSLLREKCQLKLQLESNLDSYINHVVPDMSVRGTLSRLDGSIDLSQYRLIRGLLSYNIGECLDDAIVSAAEASFKSIATITPLTETNPKSNVWMLMSIHLDLVDVTLKLQISHASNTASPQLNETSLACINFIKSRLTVETFSDNSRDIDLVSQEILVADTRFKDQPVNKRSNVFTNILQPINVGLSSDMVQAEVHHRKRRDYSKFTVLLNSMRLMAVLDWWEAVKDFIMENAEDPFAGESNEKATSEAGLAKLQREVGGSNSRIFETAEYDDTSIVPYELKLNITASEIVVVEDTSLWDTNAVILKSTTVVSYKPAQRSEPLSCNFNHCEVFSCVLGMEEETALSIIDPVTINVDLKVRNITGSENPHSERVLVIQMARQFNVRLSYHDVKMFMQMLTSLKQQSASAQNKNVEMLVHPANFQSKIKKLTALGFETEDCEVALDRCDGELDDAALWLTQNAVAGNTTNQTHTPVPEQLSSLSFQHIEVNTKCLSVCVIDDCRDADVPLLELCFSSLNVQQNLGNFPMGALECVLAGHYYNRVLSGWEPFVEPWKCKVLWRHTPGSPGNSCITINSEDQLNVNITSTLVELYKTVKENWTEDYYSMSSHDRSEVPGTKISSLAGYRRRSPFVPFALKNDTGSRVFFTTLITTTENVADPVYNKIYAPEASYKWVVVEPGDTRPFSFEEQGKVRHRDTHKLKIHQLGVWVEGWKPIPPVSIDKVGVYFRHASPDAQRPQMNLPGARVVLEVTLEGSARKLVTVRSALLIRNLLHETVELRLDNTLPQDSRPGVKMVQVAPLTLMAIPLTHALAQLWIRPLVESYHPFSKRSISWSTATRPGETVEEIHSCSGNRGATYRFCAAVTRLNYPVERSGLWVQPAHCITLLSPITVVNLLPHDLHYAIKINTSTSTSTLVCGVIKPGAQAPIREMDAESPVELSFHLDNFPGVGLLHIPPQPTASFTQRLRLHDRSSRPLFLEASVNVHKGAALKVVIWAAYWIINKTGLPLVFRQEGVPEETAGQFEEHEVARMVAPLLFSYADHEASPTVVARVGGGVHPDCLPQWCDHFHLHPGVQFRRLTVSHRDPRPDVIYLMGVEVKNGRGRYRRTNVVTLSPHYQLYNRSSYHLQFAQKFFATTLNDPAAQSTFMTAVPNCCLPFHWPRQEKEQLLCLRLTEVPDCLWSGGFRINVTDSLHVNVRNSSGRMYFLRLEIVLQGATYFVVFTDANTMPPPIRIDNYTEVPLLFYQSCVQVESLQWSIRPHLSMPYAWDEPTQSPCISLVAPGGAAASYDMNILGTGRGLTYENFIYIAFTGTFKNVGDLGSSSGEVVCDPLDVESQQLVLDVPSGSKRVILSRKEQGARSQLWRMTGEGHLQHEGSSPPRDPRARRSSWQSDKILVLDIAGPAPQPFQYVGLVLRRIDSRRKSTQTWRFTEEGRLCCAHNNMCVQAKDGFFGLRQGSEAVLGPPQPVPHRINEQGIPLEQAVSRQRLRPGSGFLAVNVLTDGPTRVLEITDIKEKRKYAILEERDWAHISATQRPSLLHKDAEKKAPIDMTVTLCLPRGLGISIVSRQPPEELLFIRLIRILLQVELADDHQKVVVSVSDIQVDNQLLEAQCPVVLYVNPIKKGEASESVQQAIEFAAERLSSPNGNAEIFKYLEIEITRLCLIVEERLLLKLAMWAGYKETGPANEEVSESDFETQRLLSEATSVHAKRYYFEHLRLAPTQVQLSVFTSSKLPPELLDVKKKLGLRLIKFEDAAVDLGMFIKQHPFETSQFLFASIMKHYQQVLKWQAHNILGSVDFLGNPIGLVNDLYEGASSFIYEKNVGALVKNVTHGISNTAAKLSGSLSDGLGRVTMDEQHEEIRQRIRGLQTGSTGTDHLVAGFKGLGFGMLGGVTSIFKQTYEGTLNEGVPGFVSGLGKGVLGTFTKPVVGVLDLISETASALRDSSRSMNHANPIQHRTPRCVIGPGGLLPQYSAKQGEGQKYLYLINGRNYTELLMAYEVLLSGNEDLRILVSSERVRVFSCSGSASSSSQLSATVVIQAHLSDLFQCQPVNCEESGSTIHYIELTIRDVAIGGSGLPGVSGQEPIKRPRVRCSSERVSQWVSQQVNYAKGMFEERRYTLLNMNSENIIDDYLC